MLKKKVLAAILIVCAIIIIRGGVERINDIFWINEKLEEAADKLNYDNYQFHFESGRDSYLNSFAECCYKHSQLGTKNIRYMYFLQEAKTDGVISDDEFIEAVEILVSTERYIQDFNIKELEYEGTNYNDERYNPERIGKSADEIDRVHDYDFAQIKETEEKYALIDRKRALTGIYYKICGNMDINTENHRKLLIFLTRVSFHNSIQPMYEDGTTVYDPIILLDLNEMRCGHVNRIACDLFNAVGAPTRVVQLGRHQISEVFYDSSWHYFDADLFLDGDVVLLEDKIPSVYELSQKANLIDSLSPVYWEVAFWREHGMAGGTMYPSYAYFSKEAYGSTIPCYYYKRATDFESLDKYYGWMIYETVEDTERKLRDEIYRCPGIPEILSIEYPEKGCVNIKWNTKDLDEDILGHRVYVSRQSREWEYAEVYASEDIREYICNRYDPKQYNKILKEPPSEVMYIETKKSEILLSGLSEGTYYISIMPYDQHGECAGRRIYASSNELKMKI